MPGVHNVAGSIISGRNLPVEFLTRCFQKRFDFYAVNQSVICPRACYIKLMMRISIHCQKKGVVFLAIYHDHG